MTARALLTKKQRALPLGAQTQTLVRIGRRATAKADWLQGLDADCPPAGDFTVDIDELRAKAARAAEEILQLVRDNPDHPYWTLPQRRAAGVEVTR